MSTKPKQISRSDLNTVVFNIIAGIGNVGDTNLDKFLTDADVPKAMKEPKTWLDRQRTAFHLWVAHTLRAYANKMFEHHKSVCYRLNMLDVVEAMEPGTSLVAYDGIMVSIIVKKQRPVIKPDAMKMCVELRKRNVSNNVVTAAFEASYIPQAPAIVIEPTFKKET